MKTNMPLPSLQKGGFFGLPQAYIPKAGVGDSHEEEEKEGRGGESPHERPRIM